MATSVVVGSILLAANELLGVVQLLVGASADLVNDGGLEVDKDGAGHELAVAGLAEEGVEGGVLHSAVEAAIGLDAWVKEGAQKILVSQLCVNSPYASRQ